jgi:AcrR family transcriptional regulator
MGVYLSIAKRHHETRAASGAPGLEMIRRSGKRVTGRRARRRAPEALESTPERILASAARLFAQHGFEGASMPAIAKAAGITAGAIYKHFESKGELLLEVVRRSFESTPLFVQNSKTADGAAALPRLASLYAAPEMKLVRQLSIEVHSAASKDAEVRRVLSHSDEVAMRHIGDSIACAQREGIVDAGLDAEFAARFFSVIIMGLTHMDTLLPHLVGDRGWSDFVRDRIAALLGMRRVAKTGDTANRHGILP